MNKEYVNLGKELVSKVSLTWVSLEYLNPSIMKESVLESIGKQAYRNNEIFSDYLAYKYELHDYYRADNLHFLGEWIAEWWNDERGQKFQRDTFPKLMNIILSEILSEDGGWYYDDKNDLYLPKGTHFNAKLHSITYDFNTDIEVDFEKFLK